MHVNFLKSHLRVTLVAVCLAASAALAQLGAAAGTPPRVIRGGPFEASGVAVVPGTSGVLFVDDDRTRDVFWMDFAPDGTQRGSAVPVPLAGADITDLEGITWNDSRFYVVGSQSKTTGFTGDGLVRFAFDPTTRQASQIESIRDLKAWLAANVAELRGTAQQVGDHVLNIEAIAWDPQAERLLLGLRAPVVDGYALVIPLKFRDRAAAFTTANLVVEGGKAIRLPLGGAGIRSLEYDGGAKAFRLISGSGVNRESLDFRLIEWDGRETAPITLRELARFPRALKAEGITFGQLNGQPAGIVVFDTGRIAFVQ